MTLSPQLEQKFQSLVSNYPPDKIRSAMIPMLMYGQDEIGFVSPELVAEVARRVGVAPLAVNEVMSYYSMLHAKRWGKFHVQICTNVSCQLTGGEELWDQACHKLGIGHRESTTDHLISLEEVECIGACSWAPAIQINYDFHHNVTPEKLDQLIDSLRTNAV